MNVLVELTGAIDAVCAAEPARLADREPQGDNRVVGASQHNLRSGLRREHVGFIALFRVG